LIERYQRPVARVVAGELRTAGGELSQCEDLCQAVFVKMVLGLNRLKRTETFEGWLFQIARNVCRDHLRSQRWRRRLFEPFADRHETVASPVPEVSEAGNQRLQHAIAQPSWRACSGSASPRPSPACSVPELGSAS
jgi:RNA polymerase sigma factor (sigma-70 family)